MIKDYFDYIENTSVVNIDELAKHFKISKEQAKYIVCLLLPLRCIKRDFNIESFNVLCQTYLYSLDHLSLIFGKPIEILEQIIIEQGFDIDRIKEIDKDVIIEEKPQVVIGRLNKHLLGEQIDVSYCISLIKCKGYNLKDVAAHLNIEFKDLERYLAHSALYRLYMEEDPKAPKIRKRLLSKN